MIWSEGSEEQRALWLMAHLLHYHRREEKPVWWAYFNRLEISQEELVEDAEAIGELTEDPAEPPIVDKRSFIHTLRFREQEHKLAPGAEIRDVDTQREVDVVEIDTPNGVLRIRRGQSRAHEPLPQGLVPGGPYRSDEQRAALRRLGAVMAASGVDGPGEFRALRDLLRRAPPRISGRVHGEPLQDGSPTHRRSQAPRRGLGRLLPVHPGPTRVRQDMDRRAAHRPSDRPGGRVGVAATSHKAIHNLLHEVEEAADQQHVRFRGWKKCSKDNPESRVRLETCSLVHRERAGRACLSTA